MAKTACEQEAEYLELRGHPHSARADALRAEGRELRRLRKLFAAGVTVDRGIGFRGLLARNAQEKARKAK